MVSRKLAAFGALLGSAVAGSVYRSLRTLRQTRAVVPLHEAPRRTVASPSVTAVVPARDEETVVDDCLRGLRGQTHGVRDPSALRIVLVDDGSTDRTEEIARAHASEDPRVSVVSVAGPPEGWTGKVHALYAGVESGDPSEWLLFVDADITASPELLTRLLATAEALDADLVSTPGGPPRHKSLSWPLLMPPGLQMIGENAAPDGRGARAFAIGHCILLRRTHYEKVGGWAALAALRNEDVALATTVRDHAGRTRTVDGLDCLTTSGMDPFTQGWASFRKSFVAGTSGSVPVLLGGGVGQIVLSLAPPLAVLVGWRARLPALTAVGIAGWAAQTWAHRGTATLMRANPALAPLAPAIGALFGGVLIHGAVVVMRGKTSWKGRRTRF